MSSSRPSANTLAGAAVPKYSASLFAEADPNPSMIPLMTMTRSFNLRATALLVCGLGLGACKGDSAPPPPSAVAGVGDISFAGTVGELIGAPLTVKVTNSSGGVVGGTVVTFSVVEGGGTVSAATDTTDDRGLASTVWRLGERPVAQRVTAQVAGVSTVVSFVATARAGAPAIIEKQAGDNQTAAAGGTVTTAPAVLLRDRFSNPVPDVSVFFSVTAGGGTATGTGIVTNANGIATVTEWRLGSATGVNRLAALAVQNGVTGNPVTFTATAIAGAAASIALQSGSSASVTGNVGALITPVPTFRVVDASGNPVAGASVTFAASTGSSVVGGAQLTNASGLAAPTGWQLGTVAQNYTLSATVGTLPPSVVTATARAGVPAVVTVSAGNAQSAQTGKTVAIEPAVRVADSFNNPLAGIEVVFEVTGGGGTAIARRPVTSAAGIATLGAWTLGDNVGANTMTATVQATSVTGNPVQFTATAVPGTPVSMTAASGSGQTAPVGTAVPVAPSVVLRDNRGNPVPGVSVTFLIGSGAGTVSGGTVLTSSTGVARVGSWTLGAQAGTQSLIARVTDLPDVVFSATATAGAAATVTAVSSASVGPLVVSTGLQAPDLPSVRVTDASGNPVSGVEVIFTLANSSSGAISGDTRVTNSSGIATLGTWTLPTITGVATVNANVAGLTSVPFTATMVPAAATRVAVIGAIPASATAGTPIVVTVQLRDQFLNAVSQAGVTVGFVVAGTGGTVSSASVVTNGTGAAQVTWTIGTAGAQTLTITSTGLTGPAQLSVAITP